MNALCLIKQIQPHLILVGKLVLLAGASLTALTTQAQTTVTDITYGTATNGTNTSHGSVNYDNQFRPVSTVTTGLGDYRFDGPVATNVFARRNTDSNGNGTPSQSGLDNPDNTTIIYQYDTVNSRSYGTYEPTFEELFLSANLYNGLRNPFANGASSSVNSDVERIDFYFAGGYTVQANDALVFFDVENAGSFGDGFRIAAFTGVGTVNGFTNAPTTYANTGLLVPTDSFGGPLDNPLGNTSGDYRRSTFTNSDDFSGSALGSTGAGTLGLVGTLIRFSDLGIAAGTTIYGYSLMAGDVAPATAINLVNWNNATYYRTNTDSAGYGDMDFMGFGAQISRPVPEPSTYGAIFVGLGAVFFGWRRFRRSSWPAPAE